MEQSNGQVDAKRDLRQWECLEQVVVELGELVPARIFTNVTHHIVRFGPMHGLSVMHTTG